VKSGVALYAVTNRHNLDLSFKDQKYVGFSLAGIKISGYSHTDHYYETIPIEAVAFVFATNPAEDVAVLDLTDRKLQYRRQRKPGEDAGTLIGPPSLMNIDIDMLATSDDLKILAPGAPTLMPSYSLLYDKSSERPVMRDCCFHRGSGKRFARRSALCRNGEEAESEIAVPAAARSAQADCRSRTVELGKFFCRELTILIRKRWPTLALTLQLLRVSRPGATSNCRIYRQSDAGDYIASSCSSSGDLTRLRLEELFYPFQTGVKSRRA
jgi:hypothetical protein